MPRREISFGGSPVMSSPLNRMRPEVGLQHAGQAVEERALAGAVRADDGADLAAPELEIDVVERRQPPKRIVSPSVRSTGTGRASPAGGGRGGNRG